jgi:hypothetical protein
MTTAVMDTSLGDGPITISCSLPLGKAEGERVLGSADDENELPIHLCSSLSLLESLVPPIFLFRPFLATRQWTESERR